MATPFVLEQTFDAPVEKVWDALTDTDKMKIWYFPQLRHFTPVVGAKFEFTNDGSAYQKEWTVTEVIEGRKLVHTWIYKGYPGSSEVTFELLPDGNKTKLKLTHTGIESFPHDPHFARHRFEDGWAQIINTNLKNYLERK